MHIEIQKSDSRHVIQVFRDDGVTLEARTPDRKFILPHDIVHFVVEKTLDLQRGFWGAVSPRPSATLHKSGHQYIMKLVLKIVVISFVLVSVTSVSAIADWGDLSPEGAILITIEEAPRLFKQCSRTAPKPEGRIWLPSKAEINNLEAKLPEYIAQYTHPKADTRTLSKQYRAQYVAFERNGARYIYASFAPVSSWKRVPMNGAAYVICDGGPNYWGIVFNSDRGEFSELEFNGQ